MQPLRVTARLVSGLACEHPVALDSLLAAVVAGREQYPPACLEERVPPPDSLPLLWHERGFHHASQAHLVVAGYETIRWSRKTLGLPELALLTSAGKVPVAGRWKAYWMPLRKVLPAGMTLTWWAVGDRREVAELLRHVFALGTKRGSGHGWVGQWTVETVDEDWSLLRPDGGAPGARLVVSRPVPPELAPEGWWTQGPAWLTYPYWRGGEQPWCALPEAVEAAG